MSSAVRKLSLALALAFTAAAASGADDAPAAAPPADAGEERFDIESLRQSMPPEIRQQIDDANARMLAAYAGLKESAEPRDWMLASQLRFTPFSDTAPPAGERALLLRNAAAAAPEDALVQWLAATTMPSSGAGCSAPMTLPENFATVMRLESDNGLAWLPVLQQAVRNKDALEIDTALSHLAAARRFDHHVFDHFAALAAAAKRYPDVTALPYQDPSAAKLAPEERQLLGAFLLSRLDPPPLYGLNSVCDRSRQTDPDLRRLSVCADIGRAIAKFGATGELRDSGLELVEVSGHYTSEDRATERELAWLREGFDTDDQAQLHVAFVAMSREFLRSGDDMAALRKALVATGKPATPPVGWEPAQRIEDADDDGENSEDEAADAPGTDEAAADATD